MATTTLHDGDDDIPQPAWSFVYLVLAGICDRVGTPSLTTRKFATQLCGYQIVKIAAGTTALNDSSNFVCVCVFVGAVSGKFNVNLVAERESFVPSSVNLLLLATLSNTSWLAKVAPSILLFHIRRALTLVRGYCIFSYFIPAFTLQCLPPRGRKDFASVLGCHRGKIVSRMCTCGSYMNKTTTI